MRLLITVLILIVLPTAFLSVLAGRSLHARELILQRRLEQDAAQRLDEVSVQMEQRVSDALAAVTFQFREILLSVRDRDGIEPALLANDLLPDVVSQSFLFMNPWEFIYPNANREPVEEEGRKVRAEYIQQILMQKLSESSGRHRNRILFSREQRLYCFEALPDYADLYAGIELNLSGLMRFLQRLLAAQSSSFLRYSVLASDRPDYGVSADACDVLVTDSLGMQTSSSTVAPGGVRRREGVLAARRLSPPLAHIEIGATVINPEDLMQAYKLQERLTLWGIFLLAVVITSSALLLIAGVVRQVNAARRRTAFLAGMSHDLRTPVTAMRVLAESLKTGQIKEEIRRREFLDAIITECDRLGDLIERVMFYFKNEQGRIRYQKSAVYLDVLVGAVVERFRRQQAGRVQIAFSLDEGLPPVAADQNALEKVLNNLIDNAIKYGESVSDERHESGVCCRIEIHLTRRIRRRQPWLVLSVRDYGDGLAHGEHRRIFNRFYRGQSVGNAYRGGFGLGLSLVADIIKAHRGRIYAYNAPDGGAVFDVWLRVKGVQV